MNATPCAILVVDDDRDTCANLADLFTDLGYDVEVADGGAAALAKAERRPFAVGLLDYRMPDMDGLTLLQRLKALQPGMLALLITGYANATLCDAANVAGARQVLAKPVEFPCLLRLVESGLERLN